LPSSSNPLPMGCAASSLGNPTNQIQGGNGPLRKGTRAQTQWDEGRGHDMQWYVGTVDTVYSTNKAKIVYDDGDTWTGDAVWIFALPPGHVGNQQKVPGGSPTQAGPAGHVHSVGQPMMGGAVAAAQPMMGQPVMGAPTPGMMGAPPPGMQVMTVTASVPGGQMMTLQGPAGPMQVQVPPGIQPGQQFQFQTAAEPTSQPVQAQVVQAQPVMSQPGVVMAQPVYGTAY